MTPVQTPAETAQERKVREEQEAHEAQLEQERQADAAEHDSTPPEGHLIDPSEYESEALSLPKIDGEGIDKIALKLTGTVELDRSTEADVRLVRDTKLGSTITLMVECEAGPPVPGVEKDGDGYVKTLKLTRVVKATNVYRATVPDA